MNVKKNFLIFSIILLVLPLFFMQQTFLISIFSQVLIFSIAAMGLNILMGYAGQISIGHGAFLAIGAYTSAILTKEYQFPFLVTIFLSAGLSGAFGLILGFPALRLTGFYLAIATIAFGVAIEQLLGAWGFVGGQTGYRNIPPADLLGVPIRSDIGKYYLIAVITIILFIIALNFLSSKTGRAMKAIRESEFAARSNGIYLAKYKLIAFVISAVYAGISGALYAHTINYVNPMDFGLGRSIDLLAMIMVGGLASISGNFIGAILIVAVPFMISRAQIPMSMIFGILLLVILLFFPKGLGYGLYLLNLRFFQWPYTFLRKWIRRYGVRGDKSMYVKIDEQRMHYEIGGDPKGSPIFMVHGNFASWRWYKPVMDRMKSIGKRGIAMDLLGFGDSTKPERPITIDHYTHELSAFIDTFPEDKVRLIAHSLGGAVAWRYALKNPGRIERMILIAPGPADGLLTPQEYYPILELYPRNWGLLYSALKKIVNQDPDKVLHKLVDDALMMDRRAFSDNAKALEQPLNLSDLRKLDFPILILLGKKDPLVTRTLLKETIEQLPQVTVEEFEDLGHSINVEAPDRLVQIIDEFFSRKTGDQGGKNGTEA